MKLSSVSLKWIGFESIPPPASFSVTGTWLAYDSLTWLHTGPPNFFIRLPELPAMNLDVLNE